MELGLQGKVALVTGSSRGIGRGVALAPRRGGLRSHADGARCARRSSEVAAAIRGQGATGPNQSHCDLRDPAAPKTLIAAVERELGGLDILINNAGTTKRGDFFALTDADWEDGYALKLFAHVRLARAAWPLLKARRGTLIAIGGTSGRKPEKQFTIGSSVNAAVAAFTKCLADLGKAGRRAGELHPPQPGRDRAAVAAHPRRGRAHRRAGVQNSPGVLPRVRHHPLWQGRGRRRSRCLRRVVARHLAARRDHRISTAGGSRRCEQA